MRAPLLVLLILVQPILAAGCLTQPTRDRPEPTPTGGEATATLVRSTIHLGGGTLRLDLAAGALATASWDGEAGLRLEFPPNVFVLNGNQFTTARTVDLATGDSVRFLVPPGMRELTLGTGPGRTATIDVIDTGHSFVQGENVLEWFKVQRDQYPRRCPACPNYVRSQQHFADLFRSFGYSTVEVDPYGTNAVHPEFANVVAYRYPKTDATHAQWLGVGGHYDVVPNTIEGALDDTAGTLATLELARVFANLSTRHNLVFGLWGGEESGLQGSAFFTRTNPAIAAQMRAYVNLDASAFSWPAPRAQAKDGVSDFDCSRLVPQAQQGPTAPFACPDPVLVTAGPDGAVADSLLGLARRIQRDIMVGYPDPYFLYEHVGQGQAQGYARINAQSDHSSFIAAGVPSYMLINADILRNPVGFHRPSDTIENWTRYAYHNWYLQDHEEELTSTQREDAERRVVQSIETYLWLTFYTWLHFDLGLAGLPEPAPVAAQ